MPIHDTCEALKGLSTLLFIAATKRDEAARVREVECLFMKNRRILVAANDNNELGFVATGLRATGMAEDTKLDYLKTCYMALRNDAEGGGWFPKMKSTGKGLWAASDSYDTTGLKKLGPWAGWEHELTTLLAMDDDFEALEPKCRDGYEKLTGKSFIKGKVLAASGAGAWSTYSTGMLPISSGGHRLRLVKSRKADGEALHAEQNLLYALAEHLRLGGHAGEIWVAGQKRPCDVCEPVILRFKRAYQIAYGQWMHYDENQRQSQKNNSPSGTLQLPTKSPATDTYSNFVALYNAG